MSRHAPTRAEEVANAASHGIGFLAAVAATPVLIIGAARDGGPGAIVGGGVFGATLMILYLASTLYHASSDETRKQRLRELDHSAIYLLIAGTYTPFTLGALGGPWGWTLFGLVWGCAAIGVLVKLTGRFGHPALSTGLYIVMGWLVVIAIRPLIANVPPPGIAWLVAGGLCYTGGAAFYLAGRRRWMHFVWHLFVLGGSTCHFFAVLGYAA